MSAEEPAVGYQSASPEQATPKKKLSRGARIGLSIAATVVLLPVLLFALVMVFKPAPIPKAPLSSKAAVEAVETYLNALATGNAELAIEMTPSNPEEPLLSKAALDRSNELAPITNITAEVVQTDESEADDYKQVTAKYNLGDAEVTKTFSVSGSGERAGLIMNGVVRFSAGDRRLADLGGFVVNGVALPTPMSLTVFPGVYEFALGTDFYKIVGETKFAITDEEDAAPVEDLDFEISPATIADFRALVSTSLDECLASKEATSPCGIDIPKTLDSGETVVDGTITRTLTPEGREALETMIPEPALTEPLLLKGTASFKTKISGTFTKDGETIEGEVFWGFDTTGSGLSWDSKSAKKPSVDFSAETPTVIWG